MDEAAIEKASNEISKALRAHFKWHENFTPLDRIPNVNTNIGMFVFYGLKQPVEVARAGEVVINEAKPHSVTLISCSKVPTSQQKVILLDLITMRVARKLGVPAETPVAKNDPLTQSPSSGGVPVLALGRAQNQTEEKVVSAASTIDLYKTITKPYMTTIVWKPEGGFAADFNPGR